VAAATPPRAGRAGASVSSRTHLFPGVLAHSLRSFAAGASKDLFDEAKLRRSRESGSNGAERLSFITRELRSRTTSLSPAIKNRSLTTFGGSLAADLLVPPHDNEWTRLEVHNTRSSRLNSE